MEPSFDPSIIHTGQIINLKKSNYLGHAVMIDSVDQAVAILDYLGHKYDSDDCLPFALSIRKGNELICLAEDHGEIGCGEILSSCLGAELEGKSVLITITRHIQGSFVLDMYQDMKHRVVKDAALSAIEKLVAHLRAKALEALVASDPNIDDRLDSREGVDERVESTSHRKQKSKYPNSLNVSVSKKVLELSLDVNDSFADNRGKSASTTLH